MGTSGPGIGRRWACPLGRYDYRSDPFYGLGKCLQFANEYGRIPTLGRGRPLYESCGLLLSACHGRRWDATTATAQPRPPGTPFDFSAFRPSNREPYLANRLCLRIGPQEGKAGRHSWPVETRLADPKVQPSHAFTSVARSDYQDFRLPYGRHYDFDLIRPTKVSADPVTRALDSIFRPEEFHVGRTYTVSCSLLTAIKRKNPLRLVNPLFLSVSW